MKLHQMKTLAYLASLLISLACTNYSFAAQQEFELTVSIQGFEAGKGQIILSLFDSEESFLSKPSLTQIIRIGKEDTIHAVFERLGKGVYAVAVVYDQDSNGELNTGFLGIPTEPVGVSNNAKGFFGPPSFEDAAFHLNTDAAISVQLGSVDN